MTHAAESTHWYTPKGEPAYEVKGKNGQMRPATLRDARVLGLYPGVSTIIGCAAKPGLENWKIDQGIMAALTLPQRDFEPDDEWLVRVKKDSQEQARKAAERGTEIHAAIEGVLAEGLEMNEMDPIVREVVLALDTEFGSFLNWTPELTFAHPLGYGGKTDAYCEEANVLVDFKGKESTDIASGKPLAYEEHAMQLAAYRVGLARPRATCANVFFSRDEPWLVKIHVWPEEDLQRGWKMFNALLDYYYAKTGLER